MIVGIARASCDFLGVEIYQNRTATVLRPYGNRAVSVRRLYDAAYDGFTGYDAYGESSEYNSMLKATIHRTMCEKCPKNLTATVQFYGDRTSTRRPHEHRANLAIFTSYGTRNPQS